MFPWSTLKPIVAAMAVGIGRAALEEIRKILTEAGVEISYDRPSQVQSAAAAEFLSNAVCSTRFASSVAMNAEPI